MTEEEEQRDWNHLPGDLLGAIMRRFTKLPDLIRFQAVCRPWRQKPPKLRQTLPWLVSSPYGSACHRFTDVTAGNDKWRQFDLSAGDGAKCSLSRLGAWVDAHRRTTAAAEKIPRSVLNEPFHEKQDLPPGENRGG
ncbi:unnamed protein product [Linum trigynum]|uniref:F-box domain-containing protein n=1 Tax=Linum trigynum TaxID=586398 RepID=A0AAV2C9J3_9ROSI